MTDTTYLSQAAYDRLAEELAQRSGPTRKEISTKIAEARAEGDLKENGGYHAAREDYAHNEARIKQIEALLDDAVIGVAPEAAEGKATQGTLVAIRFPGDDEVETYLLASREEAKHKLRRNMRVAADAVRESALRDVNITQNMFDATVSAVFNLGPAQILDPKQSTFARELLARHYEAAADALLMWDMAGGVHLEGLRNRREKERALFLKKPKVNHGKGHK